MDKRPTLLGHDQCLVAFLPGEGVTEQHDIHAGLGEELLDVGEAGGGSNVEARLFEDQAASVNELVVAAKDKHGSGSGHRGRPDVQDWQDEATR